MKTATSKIVTGCT